MKATRSVSAIFGALFCSVMLPSELPGQWVAYGPAPRYLHTAVFDSSANEMIVFGGTDLGTVEYNDVWLALGIITNTCDACNQQWSFLAPNGTPPAARSGHTAVYDSADSRMMVFGGAQGSPASCLNDVWVLDHANGVGGASNWNPLTPSGTPPTPRSGHAAAYDSATNTMIVFGGTDCNGNYLGDAWLLTNANGLTGTPAWVGLAPSGTLPPFRAYLGGGYNSIDNTFVIFGGTDGAGAFSDVWVLSNANGTGGSPAWTENAPSGSAPAARYGFASAYDATSDRLTIYGGNTGQQVIGDTWVLSSADGLGGTPAWTMLNPTNHAGPLVYYQSAIYDPVSNEFVTFAGIWSSAPTPTTADDHVFVLTQANGLARNRPDSPRR